MKTRLIAALLLVGASLFATQDAAGANTAGSISGIVRANGQPLPGADVIVIGIVDNGFFGRGPAPVAAAVTGADGRYTVTGLAPSGSSGYWVCFEGPDGAFGTYQGQCFDHVDGWVPFPSGAGFLQPVAGAKAVPLTQGQNRTGVDADLHQPLGSGGGIAGRVTELGLLPLRNVRISAQQDGAAGGATYTATNGRYLITALPPGSYRVCFDGSRATGGLTGGSYRTKCRAALVPVRAGVVTTGINAALSGG